MNIHLAAFCSRTLFIYNPKHNTKFRHIGYNVDRSFLNVSVRGIGLAQEIAEANTLDLFKFKLAHQTPRRSISNHICEGILLITEPEPEPEVVPILPLVIPLLVPQVT